MLKKSINILVLYTELASYILACFNEFQNNNYQIHIVHWPINKEAPFNFKFSKNIILHSNNLTFDELKKLSTRNAT